MMARMSGRLLLVCIALVLSADVGRAQTAATPEGCRAAPRKTLSALAARREVLEREVAEKSANASAPATKARERDLRQSQEELLEVLYQIDCLKIAFEEAASKRARELAGPQPLLEVTTYYATNRKPSGNDAPAKFYGSDRASSFQYGRVIVTIPSTHTPGNLELPSLWKLERSADPSKHFVLKAVLPLSKDAARKEMVEKLAGMPSHALLVFVHGYYTSFADAALRTAQLAHDLQFPGMAFFYSWPSAGKALAYWQDEEASQLSNDAFEQLLGELSQLPASEIYIVAHSMGNRVVASALRSRVEKSEDTKHVRALLLAAPDINADLFRETIAPKLAAMQGTQTTIYAASEDLALKASKIVHGFKRVGETVGGVFTYPGLDTIDASSVATVTRDFGHAYLMDSTSVLKDIQAIVAHSLAAKQRGLAEVGTSPNQYWQLH
jgi:esterase/lipase superfamily enzyme